MIKRIRALIERRLLDSEYRKKISDLEKLIGISVYRPSLYMKALRHRSIVAEKKMASTESYEQLEFIGDAVLDLVASGIIFQAYPTSDEGFMTQLRAQMVKGEMLAKIARNIHLMNYIELGDRVKNQGVEHTESVLADVFEALVGAVFLDHGYRRTHDLVEKLYNQHIALDELVSTRDNYKSMLLEMVQAKNIPAPVYRIVSETGPGHLKTFDVEVIVNGITLGSGSGKNKKKAEQEAAREALLEFHNKF